MKRALLLAALTIVAAPAAHAKAKAPAHPDFTGVWLLQVGKERPVPKDTESLLTPEAKRLMDERNAQIKAGFPQSGGHSRWT
jgi:hypothetical protein